MKTQTKCTLTLCGLFIVEIFPLPFTALFGLFVVRKQPNWFPGVVQRLYAEKPIDPDAEISNMEVAVDEAKTKSKSTKILIFMTIVDLVLPVTIPTGLYIVRKRPQWFKNASISLYSNQKSALSDELNAAKLAAEEPVFVEETPEMIEARNRKYKEIEHRNMSFARTKAEKNATFTRRSKNSPVLNTALKNEN